MEATIYYSPKSMTYMQGCQKASFCCWYQETVNMIGQTILWIHTLDDLHTCTHRLDCSLGGCTACTGGFPMNWGDTFDSSIGAVLTLI